MSFLRVHYFDKEFEITLLYFTANVPFEVKKIDIGMEMQTYI